MIHILVFQLLQSIKEEYKELYKNTCIFWTQLDSLTETKNVEIDYPCEEQGKEAQITIGGGVSLYYSTNSKEPEKCYFVRDLMNIREEAYETILDLIEAFKRGNNVNTKYLVPIVFYRTKKRSNSNCLKTIRK